jgi:hypothetical protein
LREGFAQWKSQLVGRQGSTIVRTRENFFSRAKVLLFARRSGGEPLEIQCFERELDVQ